MKHASFLVLAALLVLIATDRIRNTETVLVEVTAEASAPAVPPLVEFAPPRFEHSAYDYVRTRLERDLMAIEAFRPSYPFWQHVFTIPDGNVAFGSATDGRLLVSFPTRGNWVRDGRWEEPALAARGRSGVF